MNVNERNMNCSRTFRVEQFKPNSRPLQKAVYPSVNPGCVLAGGRWAKGVLGFLLEDEFQ
jgi:hypothetical protein